jgi:predicted N-acetyltransferase YhbS
VRLNEAVFGAPGEVRPVQALRDSRMAAIELVAVEGERVAGHILF